MEQEALNWGWEMGMKGGDRNLQGGIINTKAFLKRHMETH